MINLLISGFGPWGSSRSITFGQILETTSLLYFPSDVFTDNWHHLLPLETVLKNFRESEVEGVGDMQEDSLKKWGLSEVVKVVTVGADEDVVEVINKAWPVQASHSVFVTPNDQDAVTRLAESGWNTVYLGIHSYRDLNRAHNMFMSLMSRIDTSLYVTDKWLKSSFIVLGIYNK